MVKKLTVQVYDANEGPFHPLTIQNDVAKSHLLDLTRGDYAQFPCGRALRDASSITCTLSLMNWCLRKINASSETVRWIIFDRSLYRVPNEICDPGSSRMFRLNNFRNLYRHAPRYLKRLCHGPNVICRSIQDYIEHSQSSICLEKSRFEIEPCHVKMT